MGSSVENPRDCFCDLSADVFPRNLSSSASGSAYKLCKTSMMFLGTAEQALHCQSRSCCVSFLLARS